MANPRTVQSFNAAAAAVDSFFGYYRTGARGGVRMVGEEIMTDVLASRPGAGVPRDHGTLASTAAVDDADTSTGAPAVDLSFGGASAPYAIVQHERLDYHHEVGESRYLVRGVERWVPGGSAAMQALKDNARTAIQRARSAAR